MQQNHIITINQLIENELAYFMHRLDHTAIGWPGLAKK